MKTSNEGIDLIKQFETLYLTAYRCPAGVPTIGYGHTGPGVEYGDKISEEEANRLLTSDLYRFEQRASKLVKVPVTRSMFDALVSFDFNTGALHTSTLLKKLNERDYIGAADEFPKWRKATVSGVKVTLRGLVRRRYAEAALFLRDGFPV